MSESCNSESKSDVSEENNNNNPILPKNLESSSLTQLPTVHIEAEPSRKASSVTIEIPNPAMERSMTSQFSTQSEASSTMTENDQIFNIPSAESIIQAEGLTLRKSVSKSKPLLSSIEEFDPKQTSDWIKQQIKSKIESNPKLKEIHSYTKIDFFRPYFDVEPKQLQSRLVDAYKPSLPLLQQEIRLLFYRKL